MADELEAATQMTAMELANRHAGDRTLAIVETLTKKNRILEDMLWEEANGLAKHIIAARLGEPSGTWRHANKGVDLEASQTGPTEEPIAILEAFSQIDDYHYRLARDKGKFRWSEDVAFINGMNKNIATTLIYGALFTDPEKFDGFATRFNNLSDPNVLGTGGTGGNLSSIWVLKWDLTEGCSVAYPWGSQTLGIESEDLGYIRVTDAAGLPYMAWVTHFIFNIGLVVRQQKAVYRICNIATTGVSNIFDDDDLIDALNYLIDLDGVVIYVNRTIKTQMDKNAKDKTNVWYDMQNVWGKPTTMFQGIPVKLVEAITDAESALT